ncbi:MAG: phage Gp37/Gp68 family protein [Sphingomonas bacterium]|nr:phage Gp37/Gp68 family protein [Sphingomonas bacterium]
MADGTAIEWTDATWNVVNGCSVHSAGCTNCYAMKQAHRVDTRRGLTHKTKGGMVWTGDVRFNERVLTDPLRWKRPRRIFVCAHGDLFHESVPDAWIDRVFGVMGLAPQHQFQVLTKRSARMRAYLIARKSDHSVQPPLGDGTLGYHPFNRDCQPPANVWLGVSVEHQAAADERIPDLLATPAAVRWVSGEPLLGPIDLRKITLRGVGRMPTPLSNRLGDYIQPLSGNFTDSPTLDWVVAGGESGHGARPMHPNWARSLRDQCAAAGVPFLFKQWGEWLPWGDDGAGNWAGQDGQVVEELEARGDWLDDTDANGLMTTGFEKCGKKRAGRLLDGVLHDGFPV